MAGLGNSCTFARLLTFTVFNPANNKSSPIIRSRLLIDRILIDIRLYCGVRAVNETLCSPRNEVKLDALDMFLYNANLFYCFLSADSRSPEVFLAYYKLPSPRHNQSVTRNAEIRSSGLSSISTVAFASRVVTAH